MSSLPTQPANDLDLDPVIAQAETLRREHKCAEALSVLDQAETERGVNAELLCCRARIFTSLRSYCKTIALYDEALKLDPNNPSILFQKAKILEKDFKDYKGAIEITDQVLSSTPDNTKALAYKAYLLVCSRGDLEVAHQLCTRAHEIEPQNVRTLVLLVRICIYQQKTQESIGYNFKILELDPNNAYALCSLGKTYYLKGELDNVLQYLDRLLELERKHTREGTRGTKKDRHAYKNGWGLRIPVLRALRRSEEAHRCLDDALREQPDRPDLLRHKAVLLIDDRRCEEARTCLSRGSKAVAGRRSGNCGTSTLMGRSYLEEKRPVEARRYFLEALEMKPTSKTILTGLAQTFLVEKNSRVAQSYLRKVLGLYPEDEIATALMAQTYLIDGDVQSAGECISEMPNPDGVIALSTRANIFLAQRNYPEALRCIEAILKVDPNDHIAATFKGTVLWLQGRLDEAEPILQELIIRKPDNAVIIRVLVSLLLARGDREKAKSLLIPKIMTQPVNIRILELLTRCVSRDDPVWPTLETTLGAKVIDRVMRVYDVPGELAGSEESFVRNVLWHIETLRPDSLASGVTELPDEEIDAND
ncbi:MAG: tetratricopeptide repeat protein [Candidatus Gracilibacteria bacterium]